MSRNTFQNYTIDLGANRSPIIEWPHSVPNWEPLFSKLLDKDVTTNRKLRPGTKRTFSEQRGYEEISEIS